jgi:hypothetical protein
VGAGRQRSALIALRLIALSKESDAMTDFAPRVFFSHSSLDKATAPPLAEALRSNGVDIWFDIWFDEWEMSGR